MKKIILTLIMSILPFMSLAKTNNNASYKFNTISKKAFSDNKYIAYTALWCGHCKAEYKHFQEIYEKYPNNFNIIVFISNDNSKEEILDYFKKNKYTFPIYYDEGKIYMNALNIQYYPTIFEIKDTKNGINLTQIDELFNVNNFYEKNKKEIDRNLKK
ncbi:TlpA family protein disulfide reductase [Oceanivirga salmonicida]|uniref:TlpA family protein disulfide reductase n=1 Tax=Oceanivirga salmonicida TaxID=1769291 RepID=UPI0008336DC5|nr:TlpA disulfide reductase family protein [Oceanivirga salmonicida]